MPKFQILTHSLASLFLITHSLTGLASSTDESEDLMQLLSLLEQETELATQNKMNADYVPGIITLLHGTEMQAKGFRTVTEALNSVAGFYMATENTGKPIATVRGVGASLTGNNLKLMINGFSVNRPTDSTADWLMRMPLSQIERIEVIRGPGAMLYGEYAFSGVVNIITRESREASVSIGTDGLIQTDYLWHEEQASGLKTKLNASLRKQDDTGRLTNPDNFANYNVGYSPGPVDDKEQYGLIVAGMEYNSISVDFNYAREIRGGWYGKSASMPKIGEPYIETVFSTKLKKHWQASENLSIDWHVDFLTTDVEQAEFLPTPKGANPPGPVPEITEDRFRQDINEDITRRTALALHWEGWEQHRLYAELSYVKSEVTDSSIWIATDDGPQVQASEDQNLVTADAERSLQSLTLQDQWQINDQLEVTTGLRFDDYDDWGSAFSPRLAAVWRHSDKHLLKFQYSQAFRPPTLANQYPGPNTFPGAVFTPLNEEKIATSELAYIHRGTTYQFRSTVFYSEVKDLIEFFIQPGNPPEWRNRGDISAAGVELEWQQEINRHWQWDANLAYTDTDDRNDEDSVLFGSVEWLGNVSLSWMPTPKLRHTLAAHYTGRQEGSDTLSFLPNQHFDDYTTLNYSLSVAQLADIEDLSLSVTVQNIAAESYNTVPNPTQYPDGLPGEERRAWLSLHYVY